VPSSREVVETLRFRRALEVIQEDDPKAAIAFREGVAFAIARNPGLGFTVPGLPEASGLPFHTERGSYLAIYVFDAEVVRFIAIRKVPSGPY